jgi:hypothetical protein
MSDRARSTRGEKPRDFVELVPITHNSPLKCWEIFRAAEHPGNMRAYPGLSCILEGPVLTQRGPPMRFSCGGKLWARWAGRTRLRFVCLDHILVRCGFRS